jgi:hypothetical protein
MTLSLGRALLGSIITISSFVGGMIKQCVRCRTRNKDDNFILRSDPFDQRTQPANTLIVSRERTEKSNAAAGTNTLEPDSGSKNTSKST